MKKLTNILEKDYCINRSAQQYFDEFNIDEEIKEKNEKGGDVVVFDDMLDYNPKKTDPFFATSRLKNVGVYQFSQPCFGF